MARVGIIVPTFNSGRTLRACLASLRAQTIPCKIVVVDNYSVDDTRHIAQQFADQLLIRGPERSAQRNAGATALPCEVLGFIDSDMVVSSTVAEEAALAIAVGAGAVIVPEVTVGSGFWASVRAFERSHYTGDDWVEAARFFRRDLFLGLGGFDEALDAGEDWDLTIRARALVSIGRTAASIEHHEGYLSYRAACGKKRRYAAGLSAFRRKHGGGTLRRALTRSYMRQPWRLIWPHPVLGLGVVALKSGEAVAISTQALRLWSHDAAQRAKQSSRVCSFTRHR